MTFNCISRIYPEINIQQWKQWQTILGGSKITADSDCSHEIKRRLLLGRKVMINLDSILKSRDITLPTKVCLVKAMVFPVVMYGCESWTIKKAEGQRIDAFELWCWIRLLSVPWTARRSNQPILKEISPEYIHWKDWGWSWKSNNLATWCEELTHWKRPWCWEDWRQEEKGMTENEMAAWHQWFDGLESEWYSGSWWWTGRPGVLRFTGSQRVGHDWASELNWTELKPKTILIPWVHQYCVITIHSFIHVLALSINFYQMPIF